MHNNNEFFYKIVLVIFMRISWLKLDNDNKSFKIPTSFGMDVFSVNSTENVDNKIDELIRKNYNTIIVSNDVAGLSEKINKEYLYSKNVNIVISRDRDINKWNAITVYKLIEYKWAKRLMKHNVNEIKSTEILRR